MPSSSSNLDVLDLHCLLTDLVFRQIYHLDRQALEAATLTQNAQLRDTEDYLAPSRHIRIGQDIQG